MHSLDQSTIEHLHKQQAKTEKAFQLVYTHCQIVAEIAEQIIITKGLKLDRDFIHAAALVHDIGVYSLIDEHDQVDKKNYIQHGIAGYEILQKAGFPEALCRIAERHTGVGISAAQIQKRQLPLPVKNYFAETLEEKLIMYSDKFHSKQPCFNSFEWYMQYADNFGNESVIRFQQLADQFGIPDLDPLIEKYGMPIR